MSFTFEILPGRPVFLTKLSREFRVGRDMAASDAATLEALENFDGPVFNIVDVREMRLTIDDVIEGSNRGSRGSKPIWHNPKIRQTIFISDSSLVSLAAKGLRSSAFGNLDIKVFPTVEEALVYIDGLED